MLAKYLWLIGSSIIFLLGTAHMYFTFFSNKFSSKNKRVVEEMKNSNPILTRNTTMWKAWIGFNASHSSGAMFIGIINCYLAVNHFALFESGHFLFLFTIITTGFYLWLAKKYWFKVPFLGIAIALLCFILSYVLTLVN